MNQSRKRRTPLKGEHLHLASLPKGYVMYLQGSWTENPGYKRERLTSWSSETVWRKKSGFKLDNASSAVTKPPSFTKDTSSEGGQDIISTVEMTDRATSLKASKGPEDLPNYNSFFGVTTWYASLFKSQPNRAKSKSRILFF